MVIYIKHNRYLHLTPGVSTIGRSTFLCLFPNDLVHYIPKYLTNKFVGTVESKFFLVKSNMRS